MTDIWHREADRNSQLCWIIEDPKDIEFLKWLCKRLYSEDRMTGDNMRDAAQRLKILLDRIEEEKIA